MVFCCFAFSNFRLAFYHVQTTPSTMRMNPLSCLVKNEIQYSTTKEAGEKAYCIASLNMAKLFI